MSIEQPLFENPTQEEQPQALEEILKEIKIERPFLTEVLDRHGNLPITQYSEHLFDYTPDHFFKQRQNTLLDSIKKIATSTLDKSKIWELQQRIAEKPIINTADHHGPLSNDILLGANLITFSSQLKNSDAILPVFACGNVPLNNITYPRGFWLDYAKEGKGSIGVSLISDKEKHGLIYGTSAYNNDRIKTALEGIKKHPDKEILTRIINEIFASEEVLKQKKYSDQITIINARLWKNFFAFKDTPELAYLQLESLSTSLLSSMLESKETNFITEIILNPTWRQRAGEIFKNIPGCWEQNSEGKRKGSFLFWGITQKKSRKGIPLWEEKGDLIGEQMQINLKKDEINQALKEGRIIPGLFLSFAIVSFFHKIKCIGGFMQCDYLSKMKGGWVTLLKEMKEMEEASSINNLPTDGYGAGPATFFTKKQNKLASVGGLDLLKRPITENDLTKLSLHTLKELSYPNLPKIYQIILNNSGKEANPKLAKLTPDQIIKTNLSNLII